MKKNILVFPCGSEIGLEIYRSLEHSQHFNLIGASSVDDHGRFVYNNYVGNIPFINDSKLVTSLKAVINTFSIDAIYPAMDEVIFVLKSKEEELGCKVIGSPAYSTEICYSKAKTYSLFNDHLVVNKQFRNIADVEKYPVFLKPDIGYGSRGTMKIADSKQLNSALEKSPGSLILEFLPGDEYTIDCFTDRHRTLRFVGPRKRNRIMNGISVNTNTFAFENFQEFYGIAEKINAVLHLRGAWFYQCKRDETGKLVLMEIAARLAGSSAVYRCQGVNFGLLSCFDAFDFEVSFVNNKFSVELDRALENKYKVDIEYKTVYIDLDDTILINGQVNTTMMKFLYQCLNEGKKLVLITKHVLDLSETLNKYRLQNLFDEIVHKEMKMLKHEFCTEPSSIFIDDSFAERKSVSDNCKIPVFAPDAVECLLK
jgi:hypothetical protein